MHGAHDETEKASPKRISNHPSSIDMHPSHRRSRKQTRNRCIVAERHNQHVNTSGFGFTALGLEAYPTLTGWKPIPR